MAAYQIGWILMAPVLVRGGDSLPQIVSLCLSWVEDDLGAARCQVDLGRDDPVCHVQAIANRLTQLEQPMPCTAIRAVVCSRRSSTELVL
jgi:hypothetical protein